MLILRVLRACATRQLSGGCWSRKVLGIVADGARWVSHLLPAIDVAERIAIVIDDGLAAGATMRAAAEALRQQRPRRVVVAVPVAAASTCKEFRAQVDEAVCAITPEPF